MRLSARALGSPGAAGSNCPELHSATLGFPAWTPIRLSGSGDMVAERRGIQAPVRVRRGDQADADVVSRILAAAFSHGGGKVVPGCEGLTETPAAIRARLADHGSGIALIGSAIIGCILYERHGDTVELGTVAVRPEFQGRGAGHALVGFVECEAKTLAAASVSLGVEPQLKHARRFFAKLGYREISRFQHTGLAAPVSIEMRKSLAWWRQGLNPLRMLYRAQTAWLIRRQAQPDIG